MPPGPRLSVVVAAWTGPDALQRCLASLRPQLHPETDEIVVARNFVQPIDERGPAIAPLIDLDRPNATVPALRAEGFAASTGSIVAFIEDHCTCRPGWRDAITEAHRGSIAGVGGPVDLAAGGRPLDWAVYFSDYAKYLPPLDSGPAPALSGANMSWTRIFLTDLGASAREEVIETALIEAASLRGAGIYLAANAVVAYGKANRPGPALRLAYSQARAYAATRVAGDGGALRVARAAAAMVLPALLLGRVVAAVLQSGRQRTRLAAALPWLVALLVVWALGEGSGYLAGAGQSRAGWK